MRSIFFTMRYARTSLAFIGAIGIIGAGIFALGTLQKPFKDPNTADGTESSQESAAAIHETILSEAQPSSEAPISTENEHNVALATRIENPYPFPQESFSSIGEKTAAALVNILCNTGGQNPQMISGSGVFIDPRGVILTNAHVAQYVLLAQSGETTITCTVGSGAPAQPRWEAEILYIPRAWVHEHAADITNARPLGTGEHDFALLRVTHAMSASGATPGVISLPFDTREAVAFRGDRVLAASYPGEIFGAPAQNEFFPLAAIGPIGELLTFEDARVDLLALENVPGVHSGSSGGPVVNAWGRLVGIITTSSDAAPDGGRMLRAITLSYINRDLLAQSGFTLSGILSGDIAEKAAAFKRDEAPALENLLIEHIAN